MVSLLSSGEKQQLKLRAAGESLSAGATRQG
jgi:hypothetical protein